MTPVSRLDWMNRIRAVQYEEGQRKHLELNNEAKGLLKTWNLDRWIPPLPRMSDEAFQLTQLVISLLNQSHIHVHTAPPQETEQEKRERESRHAVGIGAALVFGATGYLAYQWENYSHEKEVLTKAQQYLEQAHQLPTSPVKPFIQGLFDHKMRIEQLTVHKNRNYFYSAMGFFLSGSALIAGGLKGDRSILKGSVLVAIISAVGTIANFFFHKRDPEKIDRYRDTILGDPAVFNPTKGYADFILEQLTHCYNDQMQPNFEISSGKTQSTTTVNSPQPSIPSSQLQPQNLYPQVATLQAPLFTSHYQSIWTPPAPPPTFTPDNPSGRVD